MIPLNTAVLRNRFALDMVRTPAELLQPPQLDLACALVLGLNIKITDIRQTLFDVEIECEYRSFSPTSKANDFIYFIERVSICMSVDTKAGRERLPDFMHRERYTAWVESLPNTRTQSSIEGIQLTVARTSAKLLSHNLKTFGSCAER